MKSRGSDSVGGEMGRSRGLGLGQYLYSVPVQCTVGLYRLLSTALGCTGGVGDCNVVVFKVKDPFDGFGEGGVEGKDNT